LILSISISKPKLYLNSAVTAR